ncbi:MAG TPA: ABC transporter ATP-binding protein, partial [Anaerolineales bacterium]|nr:ABC transporter ATP-binding protein [Anaerolineales bacterium]
TIKGSTMINVNNLTFTYTGTTEPAIKDISFVVQPGEIFGFLGPSGAGKSTTQKILFRLLQGFQGSVQVFERDLRDWGYDYFEQVGVSFEMPNHYTKLTARENLRYFGALYQGNVKNPDELLEMVGLLDDADTLVSQFSKGMKNRLSVARSLVNNPKLLFLDEPTAGLDPVNARKVKDLIKAQKDAGKTVFLTTHDMNIADELCDRVAFIVDGKLNVIDSPRELKLRYGKPEVRVEFGLNGKTEQRDFELAGLADNAEFLKLLREGGVRTLHTQEATLENIFIQMTGRSLA